MSEINHRLSESLSGPESASFENIAEAFREWVENPTGGDEYIRSFGEAAYWLMQNHSNFRLSIMTMLDFRQESAKEGLLTEVKPPNGHGHFSLTKEHAANLILRSVQHELLKVKDEIDYPRSFNSVAAWIKAIDDIYKDPRVFDNLGNTRRDSLDLNLSWRVVQTNVPERYKGIKLAYAYYKDLFPGPVNALEIGSSLQTGWTKLILGDYFKKIDITMPGAQVVDKRTVEAVNAAINQPMPIGHVVGNDVFHPKDPATQKWVRSQFRPSEYLKPAELERFDRYIEQSFRLPNLSFVWGNFTVPATRQSVESKITDLSGKQTNRFDMITILTTIYASMPSEVSRILENSLSLLKPEGIIVIQEPMNIDPTAEHGFSLHDNFRIPYAYKTVAWRPHQNYDHLQVLAAYRDGRCTEAEIPEGVIDKIVSSTAV